jgi:hypothetical protein
MGFFLEVASEGRRADNQYQRPRIWCESGFTTAYPFQRKFSFVEAANPVDSQIRRPRESGDPGAATEFPAFPFSRT